MTQTSMLKDVQLHFVDDTDKAAEFMRWLGERRSKLGVDTETTGFSFHRDKIRLIQFGDLRHGWAIPWERWAGVAIQALRRYREPIVLHNSKFDANAITYDIRTHDDPSFRWPWERTHDTMTMSHLTHPKLPHGLKKLCEVMVDKTAATAQEVLHSGMRANGWGWDTVPLTYQPYWAYGALDPVITCYLDEQLYPAASTTYAHAYELEMATLAILHDMEQRGIRIDTEYCRATSAAFSDYSAKARDWLHQTYGLKKMGSADQLAQLFESLGFTADRFTPTGKIQMDKYQLQLISYAGGEAGVVADTVLAVRKYEKMKGPYFDNFIGTVDANDRCHATIWSLGTRTARMSVSDPGLQTVPKKEGTVRSAFVPSEGNALITCDMDQIEMRLMAHFSEDPGLVKAFFDMDAGGGDFFVNLAVQIYADPTIDKKDSRRQLTKNTAYGKAYGAGVAKMAETAGVPEDVMSPVVRAFDAQFPGVRTFQKAVERVGTSRQYEEGEPYVVTPYGRRMPADNGKVYALVNYLIQSHAAEYLKQRLINLTEAGLGEYMVLPVHDEVVFDIPTDIAEEAAVTIGNVMTDRTTYKVPVTASADVLTTNWGEKYR